MTRYDPECDDWAMEESPTGDYVRHEVAQALYLALKDVSERMDKSEAWWIDSPHKGGFDSDMISAALAIAEKEKS